MSTLTQFAGGGVKSVQRGTISLPDNTTPSSTATINSVNVNKTMVNVVGQNGYYAGTSSADGLASLRVALTNSTTLTATRLITTGGFIGHTLSYEIIEFY